jgi:hypothetical protein
MRYSFLRGYFFCAFLNACVQDWWGLEKYIEHCRAGWVNLPWWFWIPLLAILGIAEELEYKNGNVTELKCVKRNI